MILELIAIGAALAGAVTTRAKRNEARDRFNIEVAEYDSVMAAHQLAKTRLEESVKSVSFWIQHAFNHLHQARRILKPLERVPKFRARPVGLSNGPGFQVLAETAIITSNYNDAITVSAALGAGGALALGTWGAVSMLGTASTGASIAPLHGIAASNAAWAALGSGSLATGGAGHSRGPRPHGISRDYHCRSHLWSC
jgi:hypothetical protein